jgi:hypothetical protein
MRLCIFAPPPKVQLRPYYCIRYIEGEHTQSECASSHYVLPHRLFLILGMEQADYALATLKESNRWFQRSSKEAGKKIGDVFLGYD